MVKKPPPDDGRNRNVPSRIKAVESRVEEIDRGIAQRVDEVTRDAVPEIVRAEMRRLMLRWCDDMDPE